MDMSKYASLRPIEQVLMSYYTPLILVGKWLTDWNSNKYTAARTCNNLLHGGRNVYRNPFCERLSVSGTQYDA